MAAPRTPRADAPLGVRALQQLLAAGADRAGVAMLADPFRHVEVNDLRDVRLAMP